MGKAMLGPQLPAQYLTNFSSNPLHAGASFAILVHSFEATAWSASLHRVRSLPSHRLVQCYSTAALCMTICFDSLEQAVQQISIFTPVLGDQVFP